MRISHAFVPLSRPARMFLVALVGAVLAVLLSAAPASAHAALDSTAPAQGSQVEASPGTVTLRFSEAVSVGPRAVEVVDGAGRRVDDGAPVHPGGDGSAVAVHLRGSLPRGSYTVVWRVVSADSHPVAGTFAFGVGVAAGTVTADAPADRTVVALDTALRGLAYLGAVLLVGGAFFLVALWPAGLALARCRRLLAAGWIASVPAAAGLFVVQGPYGGGLGLDAVADPELIAATLASTYGKLMLVRLLVLGFAVPALYRAVAARGEGSTLDLGALGAVFLLTFSLSEHAGQGDLVALAAPADAVHLGAACVWVGGLAVLATSLLAGRRRAPAALDDPALDPARLMTVLRRWSRTAMVAVALLVVSGTFQAWRGIRTLPALTGTTYGLLVLGKVAALVVLVVLADQGRRWIQRRLAAVPAPAVHVPVLAVPVAVAAGARGEGPGATASPAPPAGPAGVSVRRLRGAVAAELAIAAVVLGLTTVLVNTVPAAQAYAPPFSATLTATNADGGSVTALVDVDATGPGPTTVHLSTYTAQGQVLPFAGAQGRLTERAGRLGPVRFTFAPAGPGRGTAADVVVPGPGTWTMTVDVRTDATTDYAATTTLEVH